MADLTLSTVDILDAVGATVTTQVYVDPGHASAEGPVTAVILANGTLLGDTRRGTFTDRSGTVTVGGTSQQVMAANATRSYLLVQNVSTADLWVNFGGSAVTNQPSLKLAPGASFEMTDPVNTALVSVIGATTGQAFAAKEM